MGRASAAKVGARPRWVTRQRGGWAGAGMPAGDGHGGGIAVGGGARPTCHSERLLRPAHPGAKRAKSPCQPWRHARSGWVPRQARIPRWHGRPNAAWPALALPRNLSGRRATDRATRFAPTRCETPTRDCCMNGGGSRTAPTGCGEGDGDRRRLGLALANRDPCNSLNVGVGALVRGYAAPRPRAPGL